MVRVTAGAERRRYPNLGKKAAREGGKSVEHSSSKEEEEEVGAGGGLKGLREGPCERTKLWI